MRKVTVTEVEGIKVKATQMGYYQDALRQPNEVFEIYEESELGSWMERLDGKENPTARKFNMKEKILGLEQTFPAPDMSVLRKDAIAEEGVKASSDEDALI
jgi:hypothetical protein